MLRIKEDPAFTTPVVIGGVSVDFEFRALSIGKARGIFEAAARDARTPRLLRAVQLLLGRVMGRFAPTGWRKRWTDADYIEAVTIGWNADQVDLPFGREAVQRLCERFPDAGVTVFQAWAKGLQDARRGN